MVVERGRDRPEEAEAAGESSAPLPSPARGTRGALDLGGAALLVAGALILVRTYLRWPLQGFDEGVLLTGSMMVQQGKAIYRDFYSNYPPGAFWTIASLWELFGVSAMTLRYLGLFVHALLALAAGRVAGRAGGRRFSWLGAGLTLAWLSALGATPYAWLFGLLSALAFIERTGSAAVTPGRGRWMSAGLALGAVGCFRHELLVYFALTLVCLAAAWAARARSLRPPAGRLQGGAWGAAAAVSVLGLVWLPTLARSGVATAARDLFFDQVRYVMPSRLLPLPDLTRLVGTPVGLLVPAFAARLHEGAAALTLAGPALGALVLLLVRRRERRWDLDLILMTALAVAVLPQLLGRSDVYHALFAVTPALVLGSVAAERLAACGTVRLRLVAGCGLGVALALPAALSLPPALRLRAPRPTPGLSARYGGLPETSPSIDAARRAVLAFLDRNGKSGDAIFVGCVDHRFALFNEVDLYFLADRTGATRYLQFDPGLVGRREVQQRMVSELEERRPRAAVLSRLSIAEEPNSSAIAGAAVLDDYLQSHYAVVGTAGPYLLLLRR